MYVYVHTVHTSTYGTGAHTTYVRMYVVCTVVPHVNVLPGNQVLINRKIYNRPLGPNINLSTTVATLIKTF